LNYFGQGALLLIKPSALSNLFYLMAPDVLHTPLIILATLATVIASQAVIAGVFSMTRQGIQLGYLPRIQILQTSAHEVGQIYLPFVNYLLAITVVAVILIFQSSNALASAYGIAVTGTMLITDFLAISVAIKVWHWQPWRAVLGALAFVLIDTIFFSANSLKFFDGGWMPVLLSLLMVTVMTTWNHGRLLLQQQLKSQATSLSDFIQTEITYDTLRLEGTAIYFSTDMQRAPVALKRTLHHFGAIHRQVVIMEVHRELVPYIDEKSRAIITYCEKGFTQLKLKYGFMEQISIPETLKAHCPEHMKTHLEPASYFANRLVIFQEGNTEMQAWRKRLFRVMHRNTQHPADYLKIPATDSMSVTIRITI